MTFARLPVWRALMPLLVLFALVVPVSLQADVDIALIDFNESTFTFSGVCTDCSGTATATLVLQDYVQGDVIHDYNLVSFHYAGTNLLPAFDIGTLDFFSIGGVIPTSLPAFADFNISVPGFQFYTYDNGDWQAGGPADYGTNGIWNGEASSVPEPGAFLLLASAMALIGVRRWKAQR